MVTKRCQKCKYVGVVAFDVPCCDYCYLTGRTRGCPSGDKCTKFKPKDKNNS